MRRLLSAFVVLAGVALAGETGKIAGRVLDNSGQPLVQASVVVGGQWPARDTAHISSRNMPVLYAEMMPRIARVVAVGLPHHTTQRGGNRTGEGH